MTTLEILSPEGAKRDSTVVPARRLDSLSGVLVAIHDNAKPGALDLLDAVGAGLREQGARLRAWHKPHAARPSHHIAEMADTVDAAVFALGD